MFAGRHGLSRVSQTRSTDTPEQYKTVQDSTRQYKKLRNRQESLDRGCTQAVGATYFLAT